MKLQINIILLSFLLSNNIKAQDPLFSQFYANSLYLNPALCGTTGAPRLILNYRNHHPALGPGFVTYNATFDVFVDVFSSGLGVSVMNDVEGAGSFSTLQIAGDYAYFLKAGRETYITAGFQTAYRQRKIDCSAMIFPDMIDPVFGLKDESGEIPISSSSRMIDISAGFTVFNSKFYAGIAAHHLAGLVAKSAMFQENLPIKYTAHFGTTIELSKRKGIHISPNVIYQQQQEFLQLNFGFYVLWKKLTAGLYVRQDLSFNADALIILLGINMEKLKFAYSYDINLSEVWKQSLGAHEISLIVELESVTFRKKKKPKAISCPTF